MPDLLHDARLSTDATTLKPRKKRKNRNKKRQQRRRRRNPWSPQTYRKAPPVLSGADRLIASRFSYGLTPALARQVRAAGGGRAWFRAQLKPHTISDGAADQLRSWWPSLRLDPVTLTRRSNDGTEHTGVVMNHYQRLVLCRRIVTQRQLLEVMTEFWESHFHVPINGDGVFGFRLSYGDTIRARALGSFADLLHAVTTHPAMGMYLDNAESTRMAPNENLGRELLELHTVGRGRHTEDDVKSSARILTGWRVISWTTWKVAYRPEDHWTGPVRVMGFSDANSDPDGRAVTRRYTDYLASHPATVERICRKLAVKFVQDNPPRSLVQRMVTAWQRSNGHIATVLTAMVEAPEFVSASRPKVRTPSEDVVATYRALGAVPRRPTRESDAAQEIVWQCYHLGDGPHAWPTPDGPPITDAAWSSATRVLSSFHVHHRMVGGWWPASGTGLRTPAQWLPQKRIPMAQLVDHLCRTILGKPSSKRLLRAACQAVDVHPRARITRRHPVVTRHMPVLLTALLDTPDHLTR